MKQKRKHLPQECLPWRKSGVKTTEGVKSERLVVSSVFGGTMTKIEAVLVALPTTLTRCWRWALLSPPCNLGVFLFPFLVGVFFVPRIRLNNQNRANIS